MSVIPHYYPVLGFAHRPQQFRIAALPVRGLDQLSNGRYDISKSLLGTIWQGAFAGLPWTADAKVKEVWGE
jgi:hypothetical protein